MLGAWRKEAAEELLPYYHPKLANGFFARNADERRGCRETKRETGGGTGALQKITGCPITIYSGPREFLYFGAARVLSWLRKRRVNRRLSCVQYVGCPY